MRYLTMVAAVCHMVLGPSALALADQQHEHSVPAQQTLVGEVVDVTCYLTHPESGIGPKHADCAKKCIEGGLPVAIKTGNQLYLAIGSKHESANKTLAQYAGQQVTVTGTVMERDGQHLIAVSSVKPLD